MKISKEQIKELQQTIEALGLKPKLFYTKSEAAQIIGLSAATLDRMRKNGIGLDHVKLEGAGGGKNGRVLYPVEELARFYFDRIKTA